METRRFRRAGARLCSFDEDAVDSANERYDTLLDLHWTRWTRKLDEKQLALSLFGCRNLLGIGRK